MVHPTEYTTVAVKQLKCYSPRLSFALIKAYERLFYLNHVNVVKVYGVCPKAGQIIMEYCEKKLVIILLSHNYADTFRQ